MASPRYRGIYHERWGFARHFCGKFIGKKKVDELMALKARLGAGPSRRLALGSILKLRRWCGPEGHFWAEEQDGPRVLADIPRGTGVFIRSTDLHLVPGKCHSTCKQSASLFRTAVVFLDYHQVLDRVRFGRTRQDLFLEEIWPTTRKSWEVWTWCFPSWKHWKIAPRSSKNGSEWGAVFDGTALVRRVCYLFRTARNCQFHGAMLVYQSVLI